MSLRIWLDKWIKPFILMTLNDDFEREQNTIIQRNCRPNAANAYDRSMH